ncbi:unnamed protein product [Brassica oleracea]
MSSRKLRASKGEAKGKTYRGMNEWKRMNKRLRRRSITSFIGDTVHGRRSFIGDTDAVTPIMRERYKHRDRELRSCEREDHGGRAHRTISKTQISSS